MVSLFNTGYTQWENVKMDVTRKNSDEKARISFVIVSPSSY